MPDTAVREAVIKLRVEVDNARVSVPNLTAAETALQDHMQKAEQLADSTSAALKGIGDAGREGFNEAARASQEAATATQAVEKSVSNVGEETKLTFAAMKGFVSEFSASLTEMERNASEVELKEMRNSLEEARKGLRELGDEATSIQRLGAEVHALLLEMHQLEESARGDFIDRIGGEGAQQVKQGLGQMTGGTLRLTRALTLLNVKGNESLTSVIQKVGRLQAAMDLLEGGSNVISGVETALEGLKVQAEAATLAVTTNGAAATATQTAMAALGPKIVAVNTAFAAANPILLGLTTVISLGAAAYALFADNADEAAESQRKATEEQRKANEAAKEALSIQRQRREAEASQASRNLGVQLEGAETPAERLELAEEAGKAAGAAMLKSFRVDATATSIEIGRDIARARAAELRKEAAEAEKLGGRVVDLLGNELTPEQNRDRIKVEAAANAQFTAILLRNAFTAFEKSIQDRDTGGADKAIQQFEIGLNGLPKEIASEQRRSIGDILEKSVQGALTAAETRRQGIDSAVSAADAAISRRDNLESELLRQRSILQAQERGSFNDGRLRQIAGQLERGEFSDADRRNRLTNRLGGAFGGLEEFAALRRGSDGTVDQGELAKLLRDIASRSVLQDDQALVDEAREAAQIAESQREAAIQAQRQIKQDIQTLSQLLTDIQGDITDLVTDQQRLTAEDPD